jgi:hypothetical protein
MVDTLKEIKGFLDATHYEEIHPVQPDLKKGLYPFVTISREYGAGGHGLADTLLNVFEQQESQLFHGWRILDRELCENLIADKNLSMSVRALLSEKYQSELEALVYSLLGDPSQKTLIYKRLFEVIRTLATFGKVVIIGRAGSFITESLPLGIHVRLVASLETRTARMKSLRGDSRRQVLQIDRDRARLVKVQFHQDIADPLLYDVVYNTGRLQYDELAQMILTMIRTKISAEEKILINEQIG